MADKKSKGKDSEPKPAVAEVSHPQEKSHGLGLDHKLAEWRNLKCIYKFVVIKFSILTVVTAILAVGLIAVSTMSAIAASAFDTQDTSGRLVALIVLAVTAAVTIAVIVYALIATCTKKIRPIFVAAVVLSILAVIQAIVAGTSVRVTQKDQIHIGQGLAESFQMAKQHSPRHVKMWASTQNSLECCGLYSPFDYRAPNSPVYISPEVPISCCPSYDSGRSDLVQEKDREICKAKNEYFETGCSGLVLEVITDSSLWAFTVSIVLIIFEILSAIAGAFLVKKRKEVAALNPEESEKKEDPEASKK